MVILMKKITKDEYKKLSDKACKPGKNFINYFNAFTIGGIICVIGELLTMLYETFNLSEEHIKMAVPLSLIFLAFIFTALKIYHKIAKFAGAGTLVPITGFANAVISPSMEFKTEGFILGVGANMFKIAGPVIAYGISSGVIYGIICFICNLSK